MGQYDLVWWEGQRVTRRQRQAFNHVSRITDDRFGLRLHCYQGSKENYSDVSGYTHTGLGVADLYVYGMDSLRDEVLNEMTRLLRGEGRQAAQLRGPFCNMPWHWHVCDLDTHGMHPDAVWQVGQYRAKDGPHDGLHAGVPSHNPWRPSPVRKWKYQTR